MRKRILVGALATAVGMAAGFMYYRFYGCTEGCSITGNPWRSTIYFGIMFLLGNEILNDLITKNKQKP
jgi:hypothetical protein